MFVPPARVMTQCNMTYIMYMIACACFYLPAVLMSVFVLLLVGTT